MIKIKEILDKYAAAVHRENAATSAFYSTQNAANEMMLKRLNVQTLSGNKSSVVSRAIQFMRHDFWLEKENPPSVELMLALQAVVSHAYSRACARCERLELLAQVRDKMAVQ